MSQVGRAGAPSSRLLWLFDSPSVYLDIALLSGTVRHSTLVLYFSYSSPTVENYFQARIWMLSVFNTLVEPLVPSHLSGQSLGLFTCVYMYTHTCLHDIIYFCFYILKIMNSYPPLIPVWHHRVPLSFLLFRICNSLLREGHMWLPFSSVEQPLIGTKFLLGHT